MSDAPFLCLFVFGKKFSVGADIIRPAVLSCEFAETQCAYENLFCAGG